MTKIQRPFFVPERLPANLRRVLSDWDDRKRGESRMPFSDDIDFGSMPDLVGRLILVEVFASPQRFRLDTVGAEIRDRYGADLAGRFADEIEPRAPLEYLLAQCSATIEAGVPTFFESEAAPPGAGPRYARLLLPTWGDGRIRLIPGIVSDI